MEAFNQFGRLYSLAEQSRTSTLISNGYIVPRKATVQYTYTFAEQPIFGTDLSNTLIAGVDLGHLV
jgi:hypothetical protein